jgi:hypothetical protein
MLASALAGVLVAVAPLQDSADIEAVLAGSPALADALACYEIWILRELFKLRCGSRALRQVLTLSFIVTTLFAGTDFLQATGLVAADDTASGGALAIRLVSTGLITVAFGVLLLRVSCPLHGLRQTCAWLNIAAGVCMASVVPFFFALLILVPFSISQARILFAAARELQAARPA